MRVFVIALALQACAHQPAISASGTTDVLTSCNLGDECNGGGTAGTAADIVVIAALSSVAALAIYQLLIDR